MERRELLKMIAVLTGGALIGGNAFLTGCANPSTASKGVWSSANLALLDEVGETILPTTASSPGAKEAKVAEFMNKFVNDCYEEMHQKALIAGIDKIDQDCQTKTGKSFMKCSAKEREDFLIALEKEAKELNLQIEEKEKAEREKNKDFKGLPKHYFTYMKQLTLLGYFTSEIGYTKARRYEAVPGRYDGNVPYVKGEKVWA